MKTFEEVKQYIVTEAEKKNACESQLRRVRNATDVDEVLTVIKDNLGWVSGNNLFNGLNISDFFTDEQIIAYGLYNSGEGNSGFGNTGNSNTGNSNTGNLNTGNGNTGYANTGDRNTGDRNTGDWNTGNVNTGSRNTGNGNTGDRNTGNGNTGDRNTGDRNTGNSNTGNLNTGNGNTGYANTGNQNTGDRNTGNVNTGNGNTGSRNTGNQNTGNGNTGDWNTGNSNTGYANTGERNTGAFCTGEPGFPMFNKPSNWTEADFLNSRAYGLLLGVDTKIWVQSEVMTEEEKKAHPSYKTCGGYLKDIPFKEAFKDKWDNWDKERREAFTSLPNFDWKIFEEITGVKEEVQ